ncbi:MAG: hypothetical protein K2G04_10835, partial [Oscillospiraceae bacterium]|nr:hypothetical protein [Oscillospiraceae bacterium]
MKKMTARSSMQNTAAVSLAAGIIFTVLNKFLPNLFFISLKITSYTVFYHFGVRFLIGGIMQAAFKNKMNYLKSWFLPKDFEVGLYKRLGVKRWKNKMPTYNPDTFSLEKHSVEEILGASCQAEIVHEINVIASFVPLLFSLAVGVFPVFLITSL